MLMLVFLEKPKGHFDPLYPKPRVLGAHSQHLRFVVVELWADWIVQVYQICTSSMGTVWGPE